MAVLAYSGIRNLETRIPVSSFQYSNELFTGIQLEHWNIGIWFGILEYKKLLWNTGIWFGILEYINLIHNFTKKKSLFNNQNTFKYVMNYNDILEKKLGATN